METNKEIQDFLRIIKDRNLKCILPFFGDMRTISSFVLNINVPWEYPIGDYEIGKKGASKNDYFRLIVPKEMIRYGFQWSETLEGRIFWERLCNKWEDYCKKYKIN